MNTKAIRGALAAGIFLSAAFAMSGTAEASGPNILAGRDMSVGSTGLDVVELQGHLSEQGYLVVPAGIRLGYFGSLTKSALAQYQRSLGVINTGYYGPLTKQAMLSSFGAHKWLTMLYPGTY